MSNRLQPHCSGAAVAEKTIFVVWILCGNDIRHADRESSSSGLIFFVIIHSFLVGGDEKLSRRIGRGVSSGRRLFLIVLRPVDD